MQTYCKSNAASYILMDSWFFSDYLVRKLKEMGLQSICLVKSNLQFKLEKDSSKSFSQIKLLKHINGGRLNKSNLITSIIAYTNKNLRVRLVFVKARNSKDWICIDRTLWQKMVSLKLPLRLRKVTLA